MLSSLSHLQSYILNISISVSIYLFLCRWQNRKDTVDAVCEKQKCGHDGITGAPGAPPLRLQSRHFEWPLDVFGVDVRKNVDQTWPNIPHLPRHQRHHLNNFRRIKQPYALSTSIWYHFIKWLFSSKPWQPRYSKIARIYGCFIGPQSYGITICVTICVTIGFDPSHPHVQCQLQASPSFAARALPTAGHPPRARSLAVSWPPPTPGCWNWMELVVVGAGWSWLELVAGYTWFCYNILRNSVTGFSLKTMSHNMGMIGKRWQKECSDIWDLTYVMTHSDIYLTDILTYYPTFSLTSYLAFYLKFSWHCLWHLIWGSISRVIWHSLWRVVWYSNWHFIWHPIWHSIGCNRLQLVETGCIWL